MRRTWIALFSAFLLLLPQVSFADDSLALSVLPASFEAGEHVMIYYDMPDAGMADIIVYDHDGVERATVISEHESDMGFNEVMWDGCAYGNKLPGGNYTLRLRMNGQSVDFEVFITSDAEPANLSPAENTTVNDNAVIIQSEMTKPDFSSELYPTPAQRSNCTPDHDPQGCYWCTRMDIRDEKAVWAMLTAPVTVVNIGQKEQLVIRSEPSDTSEGVGVVTGASQSVHVLEKRKDGWTKIECYSSSFHDSKVKKWNAFVTGYVPTSKLTVKKPDQTYGIVIDKLTQMLYLFKEGHLFTTLAVSTGLYNPKQPYNETRSGEFLIVSKVGDFRSDAMICAKALRFNSGDLLHEVPHVKNADGSKNYKSTEYKLGTRASHGCIRVQRLKNADGINMAWLWNNLNLGTKLVIWEDFEGRQMEIPDDGFPVYYNPNGGSYYHATANCPGVKSQYLPMTELSYGKLESAEYKSLKPCPNCFPPRRAADIQTTNQEHLTMSPGMVEDYHNK